MTAWVYAARRLVKLSLLEMDVAVLKRVDAKSFLTRKFVNSFQKGNSLRASVIMNKIENTHTNDRNNLTGEGWKTGNIMA